MPKAVKYVVVDAVMPTVPLLDMVVPELDVLVLTEICGVPYPLPY